MEGLDRRHLDIVTPIRGEGEHAEGIAERAHGFRKNRNCKALDVENGGAGCETIPRRFRDVEQQQHRKIAMLRGGRAKYPRVGLLMHAQGDSGLEHGIDIEVMTVELPLQPDRAADAHAADQPPNAIAQNV
jgi:hypothetical protein